MPDNDKPTADSFTGWVRDRIMLKGFYHRAHVVAMAQAMAVPGQVLCNKQMTQDMQAWAARCESLAATEEGS